MTRREKQHLRNGLLFCAPWIIGFLALQVYPIFYSFFLSTQEYSGFGASMFIGLSNFKELFKDPTFYLSLGNTLYYTALAVPIGVVVAIVLALAMNQKLPESPAYRAILYLPSILPAFALVYIWILFTNPLYGLMNRVFVVLGLPFIDWIGDRHWTKPSIVILAQFGAGNAALIFLASLRSIPRDLYESAEIDGAGVFRKFFTITIPMLTPIILYDIIWGLAAGLQTFTQGYLIASGGGGGTIGPANSLLFYVIYIYKTAFQYSRMGYAAALALVLFGISIILAIAVFKWGGSWVHYESEE
jgi:multiple sugar transport system permease protein